MNFELEVANKNREDYMNHLVYKTKDFNSFKDWDKENNINSEALFKRISQKEIDLDNMIENPEKGSNGGLSFQEWVRKKDAEKRLKRRLVNDVKNEIKN